MIAITNIRNARPSDFDEIWAIVRSLKNKSPHLIQVPELSPSSDLFRTYLALRDQGKWNKEAFEQFYRPRFMKQMATDPSAKNKLDELIAKHNAGKSIALVCFCPDASLCHRSLISDILDDRGIEHTIDMDKDKEKRMKEIFDLNTILNTFENEDIKELAHKFIAEAPEYWYHVPASSTGKYHPSYSLGEAGLLRHTIAVVRFLNHMFSVESIANQFMSRERDLLRTAAIVHDMWKSGEQADYDNSKWTKFDHPLIAANHVRQMKDLPQNEIELIAHAVESHMGQWNTDKRRPDIVLPTPQDKYQIILHLADYLASRKDLEVKFENATMPEPETPPDINTWRFTFGKHNGKTIPEVANEDPGYIEWAKKNMEREPARTLLRELK